jgi:hypothetical protein
MRRWLFLAALAFTGLLFAFPGAAAVRVDNAKVTIGVTDGQYRLNVENTGDGPLTSFRFVPASTLHVAALVSSTSGSCQLAAPGFTCTVDLNPPPCMCNPGGNVTVVFTGTGESSGSSVVVGSTTVAAVGSGAVVPPVVTPPPTTTPPPRSDPPRSKPKAKPKAKAPLCKKGQKSTAKKPCRKK